MSVVWSRHFERRQPRARERHDPRGIEQDAIQSTAPIGDGDGDGDDDGARDGDWDGDGVGDGVGDGDGDGDGGIGREGRSLPVNCKNMYRIQASFTGRTLANDPTGTATMVLAVMVMVMDELMSLLLKDREFRSRAGDSTNSRVYLLQNRYGVIFNQSFIEELHIATIL